MKSDMVDKILSQLKRNTTVESAINGLYFYSSDVPSEMVSYVQEPSICIVLQGERHIQLGTDCESFDNSHLMFCPINIPIIGHVQTASPEQPVLIMSMKLDLILLRDVLTKLPVQTNKNPSQLGIKWHLDNSVLNAYEHLIDLLDSPKDIEFLLPLRMQEVYYRLLNTSQGDKLRQLVTSDSHTHKISQAARWLEDNLNKSVVVEVLARDVGMSVSGFHQSFKEITGLSPLQYQKSLRLMEARCQIKKGARAVSEIAAQVGYESPSQFSREYKRMFKVSPSHDKLVLKP